MNLFNKEAAEEEEAKQYMLANLKKHYPNLFINTIPFIKDDKGKVINADRATELNEFQKRVVYGLKPETKPIVLGKLVNRLGKSYSICINLTLLILEDHPKLDHRGIKGDYLLMTNGKLLRSEYPKVFFNSPGLLGQQSEYVEDFTDATGKVIARNCHTILNSRGEKHVLRIVKDTDNQLDAIENLTTGKKIKFFSYGQNYQAVAGQSFLSAFLDEVGDDTKTDKAKGAHGLTLEKFQELLVRVGSSQQVEGNYIFMILFSLSLNQTWLDDLVELARDGRAIITELNDKEQIIDLITGYTSKDNPYYNPQVFHLALGLSRLLGDKPGREMERRLLDTGLEDTAIVFPRNLRPTPIESLEVDKYIQRWKTSKHEWMFVEAVDPGMRDKMGVLYALMHPVEGIVICREIYKERLPVETACAMIKHIQDTVFGEEPKHRWFDKYSIFKTSQEQPLAKASYWQKHLGKYPEKGVQPDRSYDRMFEIIGKNLVKYDKTHCEGFDLELRKHKNDPNTGLPKESDCNHLIDCFRIISNFFYDRYYKPYQLSETSVSLADLSPERQHYTMMRNWAVGKLQSRSAQKYEDGEHTIAGYKIYNPFKK
jgi:hypothetical protein